MMDIDPRPWRPLHDSRAGALRTGITPLVTAATPKTLVRRFCLHVVDASPASWFKATVIPAF